MVEARTCSSTSRPSRKRAAPASQRVQRSTTNCLPPARAGPRRPRRLHISRLRGEAEPSARSTLDERDWQLDCAPHASAAATPSCAIRGYLFDPVIAQVLASADELFWVPSSTSEWADEAKSNSTDGFVCISCQPSSRQT